MMPTPYRCPVCNGQGLVSRPPGVAGDQASWSDTGTAPYPCSACGGRGIVWHYDEGSGLIKPTR